MSEAGITEKIYEPTKLAAVVDLLAGQGISPRAVLQDLDVPPDALHSAKTLISLKQLLLACQNAIRLSNDPHLPYRIGTTIHVSAYGMYGYAILCSTDFRKTMAFATSYHALAAPLGRMSFSEDGATATWTFEPIVHAAIDRQLYRFLVELQIGIFISLHRDVMGPAFMPREIALAYEPADDFGVTDELTGCPLLFGQTVNRMTFDAKWLDEKPTLGNRTTYAAVAALCDDLLSDLALRTGTAGKIRAILLQNIAHRPTLEAAAATLGTTTRTLRRQLRHQGTSFRALLDELRSQVAMKYLRETAMTNEDVAFALGFTDAANFRHAFRRWTGRTPSEFRTTVGPKRST